MVVVWRQQQRLRVLEFDLEGLRKAFLAHREKVIWRASHGRRHRRTGGRSDRHPWRTPRPLPRSTRRQIPPPASTPRLPARKPQALRRRGWTEGAGGHLAPGDASPEAAAPPPRPAPPTIETALGTRWAVWVGGLALALGGIFLVRYSIEAGIFGPEAAADPGRHPRHRAGRRPASSSAAPASRCRSRASPTPMCRAS